LYCGIETSEELKNQDEPFGFSQGIKKAKGSINNPVFFSHFWEVWNVTLYMTTNSVHLVLGRLLQGISRCKASRSTEPLKWYQGGSLITEIPYPVADPEHP